MEKISRNKLKTKKERKKEMKGKTYDFENVSLSFHLRRFTYKVSPLSANNTPTSRTSTVSYLSLRSPGCEQKQTLASGK